MFGSREQINQYFVRTHLINGLKAWSANAIDSMTNARSLEFSRDNRKTAELSPLLTDSWYETLNEASCATADLHKIKFPGGFYSAKLVNGIQQNNMKGEQCSMQEF